MLENPQTRLMLQLLLLGGLAATAKSNLPLLLFSGSLSVYTHFQMYTPPFPVLLT